MAAAEQHTGGAGTERNEGRDQTTVVDYNFGDDEDPDTTSYAINGDIVEDEDGHVSIRRKNYGSMPDFFNMPDMASLTSEDKWALIESLVFVVFTLLFAFVVVNGNDSRSFSMTQRVRDMFIGAELYMSDGFPFAKYYPDIVTIEDWWGWMEGPAIDALYQEDWYNGNPLPPAMLNKVLLFNQRIGKARLRQVQGKEMPCEVPADQKNFKMCDLPFIAEYESTSAFGPKDDAKKYTWDSAANNGGARSSALKTATYPGGGFWTDLPNNKTEARALIREMKKDFWVTPRTRAMFLEFTLYNPTLNMFVAVQLSAEMLPVGGVLPQHIFRTVKLFHGVSAFDSMIFILEGVVWLFVLYFVVTELRKFKCCCCKTGLSLMAYFSNVGNWLEFINLMFFCVTIFARMYTTMVVAPDILYWKMTPEKMDSYINLQPITFWVSFEKQVTAVNCMLCFLKVLKYLAIFPNIKMLIETLDFARPKTAIFFIMFFIVLVGFTQAFYLTFNTELYEFRSFTRSLCVMIAMLLGDFDLPRLQNVNPVLGWVLFILYMVLVVFVLINIFLAIVCSAYDQANHRMQNPKQYGIKYLGVELSTLVAETSGSMSYAKKMKMLVHDYANRKIFHVDNISEFWKAIGDVGITWLKEMDEDGDGNLEDDELDKGDTQKLQDLILQAIIFLEQKIEDGEEVLISDETWVVVKDLANNPEYEQSALAAAVIMMYTNEALIEDEELETWAQKVDKVEEGLENIEQGLLESHVDHNKTQKLLKGVTKGQRDIEKSLRKLQQLRAGD